MFTFSFKMTFDKVSNISTNCKNIPVAVMLFFHRFAGAQVTSERVSHELSATIWKQNGWRGEKKEEQFKVSTERVLFQADSWS